jgi:dolichyl-phosphate-mannose--protein O-mannosyl transferase
VSERARGWVWPIAVSAFAFVLRIWHLGQPRTLSFDERYYAENAWSMLHYGYARNFDGGAEDLIAKGATNGLMVPNSVTQVVHPDVGKWMIALGEWIFGFNSFGWRIASAVVGTLTVLLLCRLVLRLTRSVPFACLAGFLLAVDGVHLTLSRLALLDVFVTFWILCAVHCLVLDREWIKQRLDVTGWWPHLWHRPWQWAAGLCFGLACGTKWNGVYALAAFGLTLVVWELLLRRPSGFASVVRSTFAVGIPAFVRLVVVAALVYVVSYAGCLVNHREYEQAFGHATSTEPAWGAYVDHPSTGPLGQTSDALRSLWHYNVKSYDFHTGEFLAHKTHPYQSKAIDWLILWRPVSASVQMDVPAAQCGAPSDSSCMRETLILGNPAIWWTSLVGMLVATIAWIRTRRWDYSIPVVGLIATWVPWLPILDRPIFSFYAVTTLPFMVLALTLVLHAAGRAAETNRQRKQTALTVGALIGLAAVCAIYFWPIWTSGLIPYDSWHSRMWFRNWI